MSSAGAAFSVRFLRNGDQIVIVRNIVKSNGDGAALFQIVEPNTGAVTPNWDATGKSGAEETAILAAQPIVQIGVRSSAGYEVTINSVAWQYNGTTLNFTLNGSTWVTATNNDAFQARINGSLHELKIVKNLANAALIANKQIEYEVDYTSNGMTDTVKGSVDVLIQAGGTDSHLLQITANRVELDATNTTATLTAVAYYGLSPVTIGSGGYTIQWYKDGAAIAGATSATYTVTRDAVDGGSLFIAKLSKGGNVVAQDSQRINDVADEYQIQHAPSSGSSNYVGVGHNAVFNLSLTKNGVLYAGAVTYAWTVYNAEGTSTGSGTGSVVTVTPSMAAVGDGEGAYYADCDVTVTATI